jgi:hypothetical protein
MRALVVPEYAQPGLYDIEMGLFSEVQGDRLPIIAPDGHYVGEEVTLVQVRVERK